MPTLTAPTTPKSNLKAALSAERKRVVRMTAPLGGPPMRSRHDASFSDLAKEYAARVSVYYIHPDVRGRGFRRREDAALAAISAEG